MNIRLDELEQVKYQLEELIGYMNENDIEEIPASCNTYGLYGNFISFVGKGYLALEELYDKYMSGEDYE